MMANKHNQKPIDITVFDSQVDTVVGSIYAGVFSSNDPETVSFHDIINRIMLLLQDALTFVLLRENNNVIDTQYMFNKHKLHKEKIEEETRKAVKYYNDYCKETGESGLFFRIFKTDYFLLVLNARQHSTTGSNSDRYDFSPIRPNKSDIRNSLGEVNYWDILSYKLERALDRDIYKQRFGDSFCEILEKSLDRCRETDKGDHQISIECGSYIKKDHTVILDSLRNNWHGYGLEHDGVIDRIYEKSRNSLLHITRISKTSNNLPPIPNFILFIRDYVGPSYKRCGGLYNYQIRILVSSKQKDDIRGYLSSKSNNIPSDTAITKYMEHVFGESQECKGDTRYNKLAKKADEKFWSMLREGESGIEKIISILEEPLSENAYSMADPVFDGIVHFRHPFVNGGLHRCFYDINNDDDYPEEYDSLPEDRRDDILRIVICHYLLDGMAGEEQADNATQSKLAIMLSPIEVGGRLWAVVGYVTRVARNEKEKEKASVTEQQLQMWRRNFHLYQDVYGRLKRNLREYMKSLYYRHVAKAYAETIRTCINNCEKKNTISTAILETEINKRLFDLTRILPYEGVVGRVGCVPFNEDKHYLWPDSKNEQRAMITMRAHFDLKHRSDTPFPLAPGRVKPTVYNANDDNAGASRFVLLRDIAVEMSNEMKYQLIINPIYK